MKAQKHPHFLVASNDDNVSEWLEHDAVFKEDRVVRNQVHILLLAPYIEVPLVERQQVDA